ncbi:iron ABC transporter substrate-binding protein [Rhodococcus sp. 05-2256-B2]|uniref:iron-siderophore ABC transporter substrate-binding protein n=1 Tax=unclassified Rhodococcus (in: high G+C Gram-positive bacteria) TaxID=192944 RepID=UPI000B9AADFD|nr:MULTISPECIES: iron-siderophore ABC transporter substrate-binding protein [unclassified Rhodococcus (in: high G+C Gram-positive bacteria)]OZD78297.1 iron ABC transporter substrate-binding protein [Rhodococcus sp. 05-2256-B4]OZD90216.1 iron ABC transporter substrate-binding protein [Rhodococcus sp. 05-2256-B3]OZD97159.1 iron ABC transporter substrate-binding protein [Rhodococcus sp. 05-2256-B2]OZE00220.1 iron ABC transporter substrate-binding protein [Rhodococcus sp. 05-2256-B1]
MRISRSLALPAAAVALALTLTACGSGNSDGGDSADSAAEGTVVTDMFGEVEVPADPQRVVALGWSDAETALALGVQPVGASDWLGVGGNGLGPWVTEKYDTDPTILATYDIDVESVAALAPDLILWTRSTNDKAVYDQLSDIAPTVAAPAGTDVAYGTTWDGQTEIVAEALGKVDEGKKLIDDTETQFAETVAANPEFAGKSVAVGTLYSGQSGAYVRGDTRVDFLEALGLSNAPAIQDLAQPGKFSVDLSEENIANLDADLTVMFPIGSGPEVITENPLIQGLPSARDGRLVVLGDTDLSNAFSAASVAGTRYALDNAVPLFAAPLKA